MYVYTYIYIYMYMYDYIGLVLAFASPGLRAERGSVLAALLQNGSNI